MNFLIGLLLLITMAQNKGYQGKYDDSIVSKAGQYAPNKVGSPVQAMEEEYAYQRKERERTQQMIQGNQKQALANLETGKKNAIQRGKELEQLGEFSETLTNKLIDIQHERNEAEYQKGLARYFTQGAPQEVVDKQDQGELAVSAADEELKSVAYKAEQDGAPTPVVRQLRGMSGWARLGYQAGLLQNGGLQYNSFMQQNKDKEYDIGLSAPVSLSSAEDSGERAAVQTALRQEYLAQYTGYNSAMLNKHLFPKMKEAEALAQVQWDKDQKTRLEADRKDEYDGYLMQQIKAGNGGQGLINALAQFKGDFGGNNRQTRKHALDFLNEAVKNRSITNAQVEQILQHRFQDNQGNWVTVEDKWPGEFNKLRDLARKADIDEATRRENEHKAEIIKYRQVMRDQEQKRYESGKGKYTETELKVILQDFEKDFPGAPIPDWLKDWTTQEDQRDEDLEDLLRQKQAMRQPLRWEDLRGLSDEKVAEWLPKIKADEGLVGVGGSTMKQGEKLVRRAVRDGFDLDSADDQLDTRGEMMVMRATSAWQNLFAERLRGGDNEMDAMEYATDKILKPLEKLGSDGKITQSPFYTYSGKSNKEQELNRKVQVINNAISADPKIMETGILPNTQEDLKNLQQFSETGKGDIPDIYKRIAAGRPGMDAFQVANTQLMATGNKPLVAGPIQQSFDQLDPSVKALLVYKPSNSRTTRAMYGGNSGGQDNWSNFLNMIASVESKGFGDYDAMNVPYSNQPYNSANHLGRGLSSMTIGEVLELQRTDKVHAAGRYQFTSHQGTLREAMREAGLKEDDAFSPENQDKLAVARARWRMRVDGGMAGLRREWVGLNNVPDAQLRPAMNGLVDTNSVYNQKENMTPGVARRVYTTGNIGPTSTGQHLDVKQVGGGYFEYGALDDYVEVDDPEMGRVPLSGVPQTGDWKSHTRRGSHGRDYGTYSGTPVYVKNGAEMISSVPTEHGDKVTIQLPDGRQFTFLHGTR